MNNSPRRFNFLKKIQNFLEFLPFLFLSVLARSLPRSSALRLGRRLGRLAGMVLPKRRRTARENIQKAFPEMPTTEVERHVEAMFGHLGTGAMELMRLESLGEQDLHQLFRFEGIPHLEEAFRLRKGVILLTGHIGFWEAGSFFMPRLGFPVDFVAKTIRNPYLDRRLLRIREAGGSRCINSRNAARRIIRSLAENRAVAVLLDQHTSPRHGVSVDFFGRPAFTTPIITEIAGRNGVPVVPIFVYRTPGNSYRVVIEPMMQLDRAEEPAGMIAQTSRLVSCLEAAIRKDIDQWFWLHRRWRHYPQQ